MKQALIFANRDGQELAPLSDDFVPAMLPVAGKPILEQTLALLQMEGVEEVFVVVDRHADVIRAYFGTGEKWSLSLHYIAASLQELPARVRMRIGTRLTEPYWVGRGDVWRDAIKPVMPDQIGPGLRSVVERQDELIEAHWPYNSARPIVSVSSLSDYHTLALTHCLPFWRTSPQGHEETTVTGALSDLHPTSLAGGRTFIGDFTRVERGARLRGDNAIGHRCLVARGATLNNAVVLDQTFIGPGMLVEDAIVHQGWIIKPETGAAVRIEDEFFISSTQLSSLSDVASGALERLLALLLWPLANGENLRCRLNLVIKGRLALFGRDPGGLEQHFDGAEYLPWIERYQAIPAGAISPAALTYSVNQDAALLSLAEIELHIPRSCRSLILNTARGVVSVFRRALVVMTKRVRWLLIGSVRHD